MANRSNDDRTADVQRVTSIFQTYRKALAKLVARIVKPHDIEDIVQETYIRIYQASQKQPIFHAKSLMLKTARHLALNHLARADALNFLASTEGDEDLSEGGVEHGIAGAESPDVRLQAEEEFLVFCRSIRDLSLPCRRAFILRKVYGVSQRDIAKRLGISESTVEKHIAKGIATASAYMKLHGYVRRPACRGRERRVVGIRYDPSRREE